MDKKVSITITFLKDHRFNGRQVKKKEMLEVVAILTWVGFKVLLVDRFTL